MTDEGVYSIYGTLKDDFPFSESWLINDACTRRQHTKAINGPSQNILANDTRQARARNNANQWSFSPVVRAYWV